MKPFTINGLHFYDLQYSRSGKLKAESRKQKAKSKKLLCCFQDLLAAIFGIIRSGNPPGQLFAFCFQLSRPAQKKTFLLAEEGVIFLCCMHVYLSSILVANNDNDKYHDPRDSPVELRNDVMQSYVVFIYPHGGMLLT
jgi:hypothetical protein